MKGMVLIRINMKDKKLDMEEKFRNNNFTFLSEL